MGYANAARGSLVSSIKVVSCRHSNMLPSRFSNEYWTTHSKSYIHSVTTCRSSMTRSYTHPYPSNYEARLQQQRSWPNKRSNRDMWQWRDAIVSNWSQGSFSRWSCVAATSYCQNSHRSHTLCNDSVLRWSALTVRCPICRSAIAR